MLNLRNLVLSLYNNEYIHLLGLTCVYMAAAVLIVPRDNYVCPSDTVMFTCVLDQQSSKLKWRVTFMHQSITPIERTFLASIDQPGRTRMSENNVGQSVTFTLNSVIPNINSTMTATIQNSPVYTQMSVKCNNGSETFGDSEISTVYIVMQGKTISKFVQFAIIIPYSLCQTRMHKNEIPMKVFFVISFIIPLLTS